MFIKFALVAAVALCEVAVDSTTLMSEHATAICGCDAQFKLTGADAFSQFNDCIEKASATCKDNVAISASIKVTFDASDIKDSKITIPYFPLKYNQLDAVYTAEKDATTTVSGELGDLQIAFDAPTVESPLKRFANKVPSATLKSKASTLVLTLDKSPTDIRLVYSYLRDLSGGSSDNTPDNTDPSSTPTDKPTNSVNAECGVSLSVSTLISAALVYSSL